jgi:peroxiredoxin
MGKNVKIYIPLVIIGLSLVIFGFVATGVIVKGGRVSEFSVTPVVVNFPAPQITLNNLAGERISISDFYQQVILINNWATWCPPCKDEMPFLEEYYKQHKDQGFVILGIDAGDSKGDVEAFVEDNNLTFPILLDPNNKSLIAFKNDYLPSSYVIDRNGTVVLAWTGPISREKLEKYITPIIEP